MAASASRTQAGAVIRLFATMDDVDPALRESLEKGTYVVDPRAVAGAIIRHHEQLAEARRLSAMLVAGKLGDGAVGGTEAAGGAAGADVA
jgi:hypothetical protein